MSILKKSQYIIKADSKGEPTLFSRTLVSAKNFPTYVLQLIRNIALITIQACMCNN